MKFDGIEVPVISLSQDLGKCVGEVKPGKPRKGHKTIGTLSKVKYEKYGSFSHVWWKPVGAVTSNDQYIRVMKRRILPIIALILILLGILELIFWLIAGQNATKNIVDYIGDRTGITETNKDVKGKIDDYTSFESIPTSVSWSANSTDQNITLKNLEGNSVELAPQIYVDLNDNNKFSKNECLYNADATKRIKPGKSIHTVTLNTTIPAGTHKAKVVYRAFIHNDDGSDSVANGMSFDFTVNSK